ncbi:putative membrane protein YesL [Melghirimyces profundicolus]|uniref:Putative membrane protein YesL n=1 Tax=Melghirimyces profundicolus TaxID=1242148 RepID=A0A2T6C9B3_9BACL|nr:DUF624 domain-containing protein [Melghirimyces profundicolus]PTX64904.1 putative membrane protein YesL [Melghirimyces profundicolus]
MEIQGWAGRLMQVGDWMMRLCYVNLLWFGFTLLGLGALGLFPATGAMYSVIRKWAMGEEGLPVFKIFRETFCRDFWQLNGLMAGFALMGLGLVLDFRLVRMWEVPGWAHLLLFFVLVIYLISLLQLFPLFVHFRMKLPGYFVQSFLITLHFPLISFLLGFTALLCYGLFQLLPGLLPLIGGSLPAYLFHKIAHRMFSTLEKRELSPDQG